VDRVKRRAVILDRDGTLNVRPPEHRYVTRVEDFAWLPRAQAALARLATAGFVLAVASNQRGVARGMVTEETLASIEERIQADLARQGCRIAAFRYCRHDLSAGCRCRKPMPGMLDDLVRTLDADRGASWMVGDAASDVEAGRAAGLRTALVGREAPGIVADLMAPTLHAAAVRIAGWAADAGPRLVRR
jgi:D-glycero-D-manno-heptose 1,7-bisphosphate phosphatase